MSIYGVAIISGCMLAGNLVGDILGEIMGIDANVGGVGFAMLFLLLVTDSGLHKNELSEVAIEGLKYWQSMYIPVVAAMTASQNVLQALSGGSLAVLAGLTTVVAGFISLPLLNRIFQSYEVDRDLEGAKK